LFSPFSSSTAKTTPNEFKQMILRGDVEKYTVISNRNIVKVYLNPTSIDNYRARLKTGLNGKVSPDGPHFYFKYSGDFEKQMADFYVQNGKPSVNQQVPYDVDQERDWFGGACNFYSRCYFLSPFGYCLMRKMGGSGRRRADPAAFLILANHELHYLIKEQK
jgi:cell division protease FtsH